CLSIGIEEVTGELRQGFGASVWSRKAGRDALPQGKRRAQQAFGPVARNPCTSMAGRSEENRVARGRLPPDPAKFGPRGACAHQPAANHREKSMTYRATTA